MFLTLYFIQIYQEKKNTSVDTLKTKKTNIHKIKKMTSYWSWILSFKVPTFISSEFNFVVISIFTYSCDASFFNSEWTLDYSKKLQKWSLD